MSRSGAQARVLAEAIRELPDGLVARAVAPGDVECLAAMLRTIDIAACGHAASNVDELRDELSFPDCGWERGGATVWRDRQLVGALIAFDGLAGGRGWMMDVFVAPGDPDADRIRAALIGGGLREGRARWSLVGAAADAEPPLAKSGGYASEVELHASLAAHGFREVRRFWRMRVNHAGAPSIVQPSQRYVIRPAADGPDDRRTIHALHSEAFLDHFDFTPMPYEQWDAFVSGGTEDPTQWLIAEHEGRAVGYARGSNRYASEGCGYVASLGVVREARGQGVARALLTARFADDSARGRIATVLHVDAENPTGATRLYESVGMGVDSESVWFFRPLLD